MFLRRGSTIDANVLHVLMDGRVYTFQEIARLVYVSKSTVRRSIDRLGMSFIIHTLPGGGGGRQGGLYIDEKHLYFNLTRENIMTQERKRRRLN
jgi:predicted transcriptional regulator